LQAFTKTESIYFTTIAFPKKVKTIDSMV
jgi:hypothetical protein